MSNFIRSALKALVLACISGSTLVTTAWAITVVPPSLKPGDQYRLLFTTYEVTQATSSDIAYYNNFVTTAANNQASLSALGATWTAIASTATVNALDNTSTNPTTASVPIYNLSGFITAATYTQLWCTSCSTPTHLSLNPNETEYGSFLFASQRWGLSSAAVWTGTGPYGTLAYALGSTAPSYGSADCIVSCWMYNDAPTYGARDVPTQYGHLYALSSVLTVPTPSPPNATPLPPTIVLFASGLIGLALIRRRQGLIGSS